MTQRIALNECPKGLLDGLVKTESYLKKAGIDAKLMELIKYRVSQINGCGYCLDMHHKDAIALGETELRLHTVVAWEDCAFFDEKEKVALQFAEDLTNVNQTAISTVLYTSLQRHFTKDEIAMLTLAITQINTWNRINKAFGAIPGTYQLPANQMS